MNAWINVSAFDIKSTGRNLDIFLRWKNAVLQMLETWLSKERLLLNSTPRFLTDDEELTEQPSSVRQCSRLLHAEVLCLIINTSVFFQNLAVRNYSSSSFLHWLCIQLAFQIDLFRRAMKKYRAEYHQHNTVKANTMFPDDISQR